MNIKADQPIFPSEVSSYIIRKNEKKQLCFSGRHPGMTLREHYAGLALQGMLHNFNPGSLRPDERTPPWFAKSAVALADALIAQLSAPPPAPAGD